MNKIVALLAIYGLLATFAVAQTAVPPPPGICTGRPFGYFVRDVTDCRAYFLCTNAAPVRDVCLTAGTNFDEPSQRCVWAADSNCFACPENSPFVDVEIANRCDLFVRCIDRRPTQLQCAAGLVFDAEANACNQPDRVTCATSIPLECPGRDNPANRVFARHPSDCAQYFACVNGNIVRRRCPAGLQFNLNTRQCDHVQNANCFTTNPNEFNCLAQDPSRGPLYPHPTDCRSFFICTGHIAHPQTCPSNLYFDNVNRRCDFRQNVTCAPGASRSTDLEVAEPVAE